MAKDRPADAATDVARFLQAWMDVRQIIQAANFNRFQRAGLSATQFMTLNLLPASGDALHLTELARRLNLSPATVSKSISSLENRGLLQRKQSAEDRRIISLALTAKGRTLQNAASRDFREHMASLFGSLSKKQQEGLIAGLESLVRADRQRRANQRSGPSQE